MFGPDDLHDVLVELGLLPLLGDTMESFSVIENIVMHFFCMILILFANYTNELLFHSYLVTCFCHLFYTVAADLDQNTLEKVILITMRLSWLRK